VSKFRKVTAQLFDGREIHYFDDASSKLPQQRKPDQRQPAKRPELAKLRHDPLTNEWIAVAAHRHTRAFLPPTNQCPLCPATNDNLSEVPDNFDVAVFENKNPAFGALGDGVIPEDLTAPASFGLGETRPAVGKCEVIVFSPEHNGSLGQMPVSRVHTVLEALADRTDELQRLAGVKQVFPFENRGEEIGVTLAHPHGQIYAYSFIPPRTAKMLAVARAHKEKTGKVLFDQILAREIRDGVRVIARNEHWIAYTPYASRYPFEIHVAPLAPVADLSELSPAVCDSFPAIAIEVMQRLDGVFGIDMAYIAAWHQAPVRQGRDLLRLHWQITSVRRAPGKLKYLAGSESAMGAFIMDMKPEQSATQLKDVKL
jgi:UDPglucose--hexose-1-phosphate uridylyltransferase